MHFILYSKITAHRFEPYNVNGGRSALPAHAVKVGIDQDGSEIFLGRVNHNGDVVPAKVIPSKSAAYIPWGGKEVLVSFVEILREVQYIWKPSANGQVPHNAVPFGTTSSGEALFAGRCTHEGSLTPGKVQPSHGCIYIPFNGSEVAIKQYEVLCMD